MSNKQVVLVVGVGNWGNRLVERFKFIADVIACDLDVKKVEAVQKYGIVGSLDARNLEGGIRYVDAVVVATPPSTHYELAKLALSAGKHTLVEKPLTLDFTQATELYELARNKGVTLMTDDTFMYTDFVRDYRSQEVRAMQALWTGYRTPDPSIPEEGILWTLGPHPASLMLHFMQQFPVAISGQLYANYANILYRFPGGAEANIVLSWVTPIRRRSIYLNGTLTDFDSIKQEPDPLTRMCAKFIERCSAAYFLDRQALDVVDLLQITKMKLTSLQK